MSSAAPKVIFITGSGRGLGRSFTEFLLEQGYLVAATARDISVLDELVERFPDNILPISLDVRDEAQVQQAIAKTVEHFERIDVVINNAGYGFIGAFEAISQEDFRGQIDTNFWGVVNVTRAVLPVMRRQKQGHIIQISTIGGRCGTIGLSGYSAAKFAVEGFSEAVSQEVKGLGIDVTLIGPGGFRTDWAGASMAFAPAMEDYEEVIGPFVDFMKNHHSGIQEGSPLRAAQVICGLIEMSEPPLRLPMGSDAIQIIREGYEVSLAELERWTDVSESTDFGSELTENDLGKLLNNV